MLSQPSRDRPSAPGLRDSECSSTIPQVHHWVGHAALCTGLPLGRGSGLSLCYPNAFSRDTAGPSRAQTPTAAKLPRKQPPQREGRAGNPEQAEYSKTPVLEYFSCSEVTLGCLQKNNNHIRWCKLQQQVAHLKESHAESYCYFTFGLQPKQVPSIWKLRRLSDTFSSITI